MQSISIHSIGRDGSNLKLKDLNEKRKLFDNFSKIKKTLIDIRDGCNIDEEGVVFIISNYVGMEMNLKKIHKSIPTIIRTQFIKPSFVSIAQFKKWFKYYFGKYSDAYQIIENHQEYQVAVRYPANRPVQTVNQVAIQEKQYCSNCDSEGVTGSRCSDRYNYHKCNCHCHISLMRDEDCKGGFTVAKKEMEFFSSDVFIFGQSDDSESAIIDTINTELGMVDINIQQTAVHDKVFKMCRMEKNGTYNCYCDDN